MCHFIIVQPIAFGVSFLHSYGITFIWDHIRMGSHSYDIVQPIAFGASLHLNLQFQSHWCLVNDTWQKKARELDYRLKFEIEETTLQMQ